MFESITDFENLDFQDVIEKYDSWNDEPMVFLPIKKEIFIIDFFTHFLVGLLIFIN